MKFSFGNVTMTAIHTRTAPGGRSRRKECFGILIDNRNVKKKGESTKAN